MARMPVPDSAPSSIEIELVPTSDAYQSNDQRWQNQVALLLSDLKRSAIDVRKDSTPVAGEKGAVEAIILALGSSGTIAAAVAIFKSWLTRSSDRSLKIKGKIGGRDVDLELTGTNIDEKTLRLALGLAKD